MKLHSLLCPVESLAPALAFFTDTLQRPPKLHDGGRYAAFDIDGCTLALAAGDERLGTAAAPVLRVDDIRATLARMSSAGAVVLQSPQRGPHEWRALLQAPGGVPVILSERLRGAQP